MDSVSSKPLIEQLEYNPERIVIDIGIDVPIQLTKEVFKYYKENSGRDLILVLNSYLSNYLFIGSNRDFDNDLEQFPFIKNNLNQQKMMASDSKKEMIETFHELKENKN